jgi:hypothetical protein
MPTRTERDILIDDAVDAYVDWREQSAAVEAAYRRWTVSERGESALAFAAYVAALDREERASSFYARILELASARAA